MHQCPVDSGTLVPVKYTIERMNVNNLANYENNTNDATKTTLLQYMQCRQTDRQTDRRTDATVPYS